MSKNNISVNRRNFLRIGGAGVALGAFAPIFNAPFLRRSVEAAMLGGGAPKKLIVIFLRGGCDGVNTLIPHGDGEYNDMPLNRPTLFVSPAEAIDLGNSFASLHPSLAKAHEIYQVGQLACIHRVAYANQSRSHFDSQNYWENAIPGSNLEEGWINRYVDVTPSLDLNDLAGVSISNQLQFAFRGDRVLTHLPNLATYTLGTSPAELKLLGAVPANGDSGSGLLGVYSRAADDTDFDPAVRNTGLTMAGSLDATQLVDPATYVPEGGATYPTNTAPGDFPGNGTAFNFFRQVRDGVQLLKETDARVVGVELGGLDTHSNQGKLAGQHPTVMEITAHAMRSIWQDLSPSGLWNDTLVVTMSEFGRTSRENGSAGTDHGEASCMFIAGGSVNGGVYNCDSTTWATGDLFSTSNGRYITHRTDFRAILAEIVDRHLGATPSLNTVIPGWSGLTGPTYNYLNFLP